MTTTPATRPSGRPSPHQRRLIAARAVVDPRSVDRYFAEQPIRSTTETRVEQALRDLGFQRFLRAPQSSNPQSTLEAGNDQ